MLASMTPFELTSRIERLKTYYAGVKDGVTMYAHWKDGVQYVGTTGKTLKKALEDITAEEKQKIDEIRFYNVGR
jgi:hypothetical protein